MHKIFFFLVVFMLLGCSSDNEGSDSEPGEQPSPVRLNNSLVQKGPFVAGSGILIIELNDDLESTSISYNTETVDDFGSFDFNSSINSNKLDIEATGFYFNEITGELSNGQITLRSFIQVSEQNKSNINILTTLSRQRIKHLMLNENMSYEEAKIRAEKEVLRAFNIPEDIIDDLGPFQDMDISQEGTGNAILLAVSCVLQGNNGDGELSELVTKFANDLESDGIIETDFVVNKIKEGGFQVNPISIKNNLTQRFESLGVEYSLPNFELYVDSDGNGRINGYDVTPTYPSGLIEETKPTINWVPSIVETVMYDVQLSDTSNFENLLIDANNVVGGQISNIEVLERGRTYYWRVRLKEENVVGEWKQSTFDIKTIEINNLSPGGGGEMGNSKPIFSWEHDMAESLSFQFQLSTDSEFLNLVENVDSGLETNQYVASTILEDNVTYFWRVRAMDSNGVLSEWETESFQFELPILLTGMPEEIGDSTPIIRWEEPYFIDQPPEDFTYEIQVSTDIDFNDIKLDVGSITQTFYQVSEPLDYNIVYYYRLRLKDGNGALSEWSVPLNFKFVFIPVDSAAIYPTGEIIETLPLFDWSDAYFPYPQYAPESVTYQLQIAYTQYFDNIILDVQNIVESQYQTETEFSLDTEYYYRIRYFDENNVSSDWAWTVFHVSQ
ncbi:hypothetical protein V1387_03935 [Allomuricauda taeanensis]|uniref:hypothetical protein n=1 Tax=Flagellimonas taeanensis TaxID=1005926 RepID=UPI002E7C39A7|nr:hypothetical protein [Allomuricauda taeanensis]MEE1961824.1 hypothetical protein [Allomuricauda taeanensis]